MRRGIEASLRGATPAEISDSKVFYQHNAYIETIGVGNLTGQPCLYCEPPLFSVFADMMAPIDTLATDESATMQGIPTL